MGAHIPGATHRPDAPQPRTRTGLRQPDGPLPVVRPARGTRSLQRGSSLHREVGSRVGGASRRSRSLEARSGERTGESRRGTQAMGGRLEDRHAAGLDVFCRGGERERRHLGVTLDRAGHRDVRQGRHVGQREPLGVHRARQKLLAWADGKSPTNRSKVCHQFRRSAAPSISSRGRAAGGRSTSA